MFLHNCHLDMLKKREEEIKFFQNLFEEAILIKLKAHFYQGSVTY